MAREPKSATSSDKGATLIDDVVLEARSLVKHYPTRHRLWRPSSAPPIQAVQDVSFQLHRGETLGIVGESGSGKSTLAKLLIAVERPTSGTVTVEGRDLFSLRGQDLHRARRNIQMILQDPYASLDPRMTAGEIVGEAFAVHPDIVPRGNQRAAVADLFELVGLNPDHIRRYPHQFSGGQRQRLGIARALALQPRIIVCDEPVSALDLSVQGQVLNLLMKLQRELSLSYIFIGHDLSVVRHVSDRVAVMYLGKLVEIGTREAIYEQPQHPYTRALLSSVPKSSAADRRERIVLRGEVPSAAAPPSGCRFRTRCWMARDVCSNEEPLLESHGLPWHLAACHFAGHPRGV